MKNASGPLFLLSPALHVLSDEDISFTSEPIPPDEMGQPHPPVYSSLPAVITHQRARERGREREKERERERERERAREIERERKGEQEREIELREKAR